MLVQDLVNQLVMFPPNMEVYILREDLERLGSRYAAADSAIMGDALVEQVQDAEGNDISKFKRAIIIKGVKK